MYTVVSLTSVCGPVKADSLLRAAVSQDNTGSLLPPRHLLTELYKILATLYTVHCTLQGESCTVQHHNLQVLGGAPTM